MTESPQPRGISPDYLATIYEGPLRAAALSAELARHSLQAVEGSPEATADRLRAAQEHVVWTERHEGTLQAAGRAGLSTIDDFPPEDTLRAQMKMDLHPKEEIDAVFGHIEAMDDYAQTDNAVIAVVGAPIFRHPWLEDNTSVVFVTPESAEDEPAATIGRTNGRHSLDLQTGRLLLLDIGPESHIALSPSTKRARYQSDGTLEQAVFVTNASEVTDVFERGLLADTAFVYGDEAVQELINALGRKKEGLRPLLYGGMNYLGRDYEVEALDSSQAKEVAERKFYNDLNIYLIRVISNASINEADRNNFTLLTPETARFIGISDDGVAEEVNRMLIGWSFADDGAIVKSGSNKAVKDAWTDIWGALQEQGFIELADRMLQPTQSVHDVASIERQALLRALERQALRRALEWDTKPQRGSRPLLTRQQIKGINRAIEEADAKIDQLEDNS